MTRLAWANSKGRFFIGRNDIGDYMHRWLLQTPWFTIRLHHILRDDRAEGLHDHPWDFTSLLLTGPYEEVLRNWPEGGYSRVRHERWSVVRHRAEDLHRIELPAGPVWTLVWCGPMRREWGFLTAAGWRPWRVAREMWGGRPNREAER